MRRGGPSSPEVNMGVPQGILTPLITLYCRFGASGSRGGGRESRDPEWLPNDTALGDWLVKDAWRRCIAAVRFASISLRFASSAAISAASILARFGGGGGIAL